MSDFEGLKPLVTGGALGIGRATAELLAERGARVAVLDLDPSPVDRPLLGHRADVTDDGSVRETVAASVADLGGLDVLINHAGIGAQGTVEDNPDDEWHRVYDVNVLGMVRTPAPACPTCAPPHPPRSSTPAPSPPPRACLSAPCTAPPRAPCTP
jgi:NAD(P)-dependent dehydrogenase (short-subunit alcohol dehydrogenase family)